MVLLLLAAVPSAEAAFERHEIVSGEGDVLAVVVLDTEKAVTRGSGRGFLVLVENPNATANVTVGLAVVAPNGTGLAYATSENATIAPRGVEELAFRVQAPSGAPLGRQPITLVVTASRDGANATAARLAVVIDVSDLPTPFGESVDTLSPGERTTLAVGLLGLVGGALLVGLARRLRRPRS